MPTIKMETLAEVLQHTPLSQSFDATMLPPGAAHAACLALVALPSMPALQARSQPSLVCAFCNSCPIASCSSTAKWVRRRTRGLSNPASSSSQVLSRSPLQYPPLLDEGGPLRRGEGPFVMVASRWGYDASDDDDEDDGRGGARNRRTAPWEDIQWSNVPAARKAPEGSSGGGRRRGRRGRLEEEEEEEEEEWEEDLSLGEKRRDYFRSGNDNNDREADYYEGDGDGDDDGDYIDDDGLQQQQRRRRSRAPAPAASKQRDVEPSSPQWNAGWFRDAQEANQSSMFSWARSLYNALFWYGGASEDAEQLPAMNFQDLLERFDSIAGNDSSGKSRPIVPPEDLGAEQDYRWRPSARDSATAPEGRGQRRRKPKGYAAGGEGGRRGARMERERELEWDDDREQWPASREPPLPRRREEAFRGGGEGGGGERRERERGRGESRGGGGREGGGEADAVAIGQLRRKQKQLADREHKLEGDLEKVRERLGVVDATVELWLRRSAAMLSRGGSETDTEVLQAKRRIYGLKDEGRQLDSARVAVGERLEDCRAKLDRIVQELQLLGEDAVPPMLYERDEELFTTAGAEGERDERTDEKADFEAGVAQMDELQSAAEEQNKEALPAVGEAEK